MKKIVIGNWKLNPTSQDEAKIIIRRTRACAANLKQTEVVACPPFVYIPAAISKNTDLKVGAQSVSAYSEGPHTGEVSARMLRDIGVKFVIVGHSEERARGDSEHSIAERAQAVVESGMEAVICVGEKVRDEAGAYLEQLKEQIKKSLSLVPANRAKNIILAYEPVWAIGAKEAMNPEQIYEMSIFVKKVFSDVFNPDQAMKVTVLYGGSVNATNAMDIMKIGQVDGLLVGRESVNPGFVELLKAVDAA